MPDPTTRPNIVLIMVDQWRGDCLEIDGHPRVETPFLNQLAQAGTRFTRAYSSSPTCIAARAALMTGLSQRSHGRVGYQDMVPWNYDTTLAGEFTRHGYQTQSIGKMHVYPERSQVGFQNVILHDGFLHRARAAYDNWDMFDDYLPWLRAQLGRDAEYFEHGVDCNSWVARPWDKPEFTHPTNYVTGQAIDFLRRRDRRKPFLLFVSYHRPHPPYDPPAWAFEQYLREPLEDVPVGDWAGEFASLHNPFSAVANAGQIKPAQLHRARSGYYGLMTHIDHQLRRLDDALTEHHAHDNTYFCFTADHGELLGDHHLFRKALPYEGSARIPMILAGPEGSGLERNVVRNEIAELRDVMPTLLECAGLPLPACVEGRSLLTAGRGDASWREYIHGEHTYRGGSVHWVVTPTDKYVWFSATGHEQYFDLASDPQELHDLARAPAAADRVAHLRAALVTELTGREEGFTTDGRMLIPGRPVKPTLSHIL